MRASKCAVVARVFWAHYWHRSRGRARRRARKLARISRAIDRAVDSQCGNRCARSEPEWPSSPQSAASRRPRWRRRPSGSTGRYHWLAEERSRDPDEDASGAKYSRCRVGAEVRVHGEHAIRARARKRGTGARVLPLRRRAREDAIVVGATSWGWLPHGAGAPAGPASGARRRTRLRQQRRTITWSDHPPGRSH